MDCGKALSEKPGALSPSLGPSCYILDLEQASLCFLGFSSFLKILTR